MLSQVRWLLQRTLRQTWVRVVSFAALAIATVVATRLLAPLIPSDWADRIGADAVDQLLSVLATSMLAVTTFSLSVAVSAFAAASSSATPRATRLLQEDRTTQNVLATFLGAFIFGLVGIILLKAGYFATGGLLVLFATTALVIALVVAALLRWITHLMGFGRMGDILDRMERAATGALSTRLSAPYLGGHPWVDPDDDAVEPLYALEVGYVQHVDVAALHEVAARLGVSCWIDAVPGQFVHHAVPLLRTRLEGVPADDVKALRAAFTCAAERTFDQDPRFGLVVFAEIASRALSPAVNDPGTAINVISRVARVLAHWETALTPEVTYPTLHVRALEPGALLRDAFRPIARDGAGMVEVQCHLQDALAGLAALAPDVYREGALAISAEAVSRVEQAHNHPDDLARVREAAQRIGVTSIRT